MNGGRGRSIACARCATPLEPGARFCTSCGQPSLNPIDFTCPLCTLPVLPGNAHCEACGASLSPRPYLVVNASGLRLNLFAEHTEVVLGRTDALSGVGADLDLEPFGGALAGLSRRHARLTWRDDSCQIEDLNSVNWTYLNQQRLLPGRPTLLKDGDLLRLGNVLLTYRAG
jgi:hypothetical protein